MNSRIRHFARLVALLTVLMALPAVVFSAQTQIVNINSRANGLSNAVQVVLDAGTYSVTPIGTNDGGAFNAWNAWGSTSCSNVNGCVRTSPTTSTGWINGYWILSPNLTKVSVKGSALTPVATEPVPTQGNVFLVSPTNTYYRADDLKVYPADIVALAKSQSSTFTLSQSGPVRFAINDSFFSDNVGGISLQVTLESTAPIAIDSTSVPKAIKIGEFFSKQLEVLNGVGPFVWSVTDGDLAVGMELSADGVLSGTPTALGSSTFTVQVRDSTGAVSQREFAVEVVLVLPPPTVRAFKSSTRPVPGRLIDYFVVLENTGTSSTDVHLHETLLPPANFTFVSASPAPDFAHAGFVFWDVRSMGPGESRVLQYKVRLNPTIEPGSTVTGTLRLRDRIIPRLAQEVAARALERAKLEDKADWHAMLDEMEQMACTNKNELPNTRRAIDALFDACVNPNLLRYFPLFDLQFCVPAVEDASTSLNILLKDCKTYMESGVCNSPPNWVTECNEAVAPVDPNEKLVVANSRRLADGRILSYIQTDQTLVFPIHFENIGSVEARDVFVTDVLDPNLDASTLELLTPDRGSYDPGTRTVRWALLGRNLLPGETGNVLLSIKPVLGLPSGTEIRNSAEIQFEIFAPLVTPEVVSVIDSTPPVCSMAALPAQTAKLDVPLAWNGSDAVGEIDTYSILVAENGGDFQPSLRDRSRVVPRSDRACVFTERSVVKMQALRHRVESLRNYVAYPLLGMQRVKQDGWGRRRH